MKKTISLIISILIFGCIEDNEITDSTGTKLLSINHSSDGIKWMESYHYDSDDKLTEVEDLYSLGRRYEIEYENGQMMQYITYRIDDNKKIFRDSISYTADGQIDKIYKFSINSGENLPLDWIYEFEYDSAERVIQRRSYFNTIERYMSTEKYYWSENNISRKECYNEDEELQYEFFYTYDDKNNYKINIPPHIDDPINWSLNNVTVMDWKDYYGNLDIICRPCESSYRYNLDGYPVEVSTNTGRKIGLKYE